MTRTVLMLVVAGAVAATGCQPVRQAPGNGAVASDAGLSGTGPESTVENAPGKAPASPDVAVRLGKAQVVTLSRRPPVSEVEGKAVKALIASLASLDSPDFGLSATLTGQSFAPVPGQSQASTLLFTDHKIQASAALQKLVEVGPRALPFLLDALDDHTPTKLKVKHDTQFDGAMYLANELWGNPVNPVEQQVLSRRKEPAKDFPENCIDTYTVKVGDVCFVAIGQIVGRPYLCVRYQPTACVVINSPIEDAELRAEVRAIWASKDPEQHVLDSLLTDYATEGIYQGRSLDGWSVGSDLQVGAALRLLYYYPRESVPFVAARLRSFDVRDAGNNLERWMKREACNGVQTTDFIKAVRWSSEPLIQDALRDIEERTNDKDIEEGLKRGRARL